MIRWASNSLGCVDGFDENEGEAESDEGAVVLGGFLAAEGNPLEAFELADGLLDAGAAAVERAREKGGRVLRRGFVRDDRTDAARARRLAIVPAVIAFVAESRARRDLRPKVEQDGKVAAVAGLAFGQVEGDRQAGEIGLEMDLGGEAAARAAERLTVLPPLAPAAETCARTTVESNI